MKKILLLGLVAIFTITVNAQSNRETTGEIKEGFIDVPVKPALPMNTIVAEPVKQINKQGKSVTIVPTGGNAGNAYGLYAGGKTAIWADNDLNTLSFIHRANLPSSGHLRIDISTDGGATWTGNIGPVYSPDEVTHFNARYPQALIYNPTGNTDPDDAYVVFMAPTLDDSNDNWGGICYGTWKIDSAATSFGSMTSVNPLYYLIPSGMTINSDGKIMGVDRSFPETSQDYEDSLVIFSAEFNSTTEEFEFSSKNHYFPVSDATMLSTGEKSYPLSPKIAFHPTDPNIGYIATLTHQDITTVPDEGYYPVVMKTTDGGQTWSAPIPVPLKGFGDLISPDFITDDELQEEFHPNPAPDRSDIWFRTAFDLDLVVDGDGNPHIAVVVSIGDNGLGLTPFAVFSGFVLGMFNIWSPDGGTTWDAKLLSRLMNFRGQFGDISEDPRPQASTTPDGSKVFFSWLNTDTLIFGPIANIHPDIYVVGFDPVTDSRTQTFNVTAGTLADGGSFMATMPEFVFADGGTYTIPFVYQDFNPSDPLSTATFWYVHGFEITDQDFQYSTNNIIKPTLNVSQNYPNPFNGYTNIDIQLDQPANVKFTVHNVVGQVVYQKNYGVLPVGTHKLELIKELNKGIYMYTVQAGEISVTKKMMVK